MAKQAKAPEIYKFGGASLGDGAAFKHAASIVKRCPGPLVAVCSAPAGVTDLLLEVAERARPGETAKVAVVVATLREKYAAILRELALPARLEKDLAEHVEAAMRELETLAGGLAVLRELTARTSDLVVARGERVGTRLFVAALGAAGVKAEYVDALEVVVTRGPFGGAAPDLDATDARARKRLRPLLAQGILPVVPGFLGAVPAAARRPAGADHAGARRDRSDRHPDGAGAGRQPGDAVEGRAGPADRRPAAGPRRPHHPAAERARGGRAGLLRRQGAASAGADPPGRPGDPAVRPAVRRSRPAGHGDLRAPHAGRVPGEGAVGHLRAGAGHGGRARPDRCAGRRRPHLRHAVRCAGCRSR